MARRTSRKKDSVKDRSGKIDTAQRDAEKKKECIPGIEEQNTAGDKNDPEWYMTDPQILMDAASIPFSHPMGESFRLGTDLSLSYVQYENGQASIPHSRINAVNANSGAVAGICSLVIKPSIGFTDAWTDPANVAATTFYTHVRYATSGRKNYDPVDLMIYGLAMADIYSFIFWCKRLYSYAFMYSQTNKYLARELIRANGVNPDNLTANLANFRYWLNTYINKVSSWILPSTINLFKRKAFMYSGLYTENHEGNLKDQMYQFVPAGFFQFSLDDNSAGQLKIKYWNDSAEGNMYIIDKHVEDIIAFGESLLANINGDEDFALMSGDILKAYDASNIIGLTAQEAEAGILPVYDPLILSQFKNATICATADRTVNKNGPVPLIFTYGETAREYGSIWQSGGLLKSRSVVQRELGGVLSCAMKKLLSIDSASPTPVEVMEATRLMVGIRGAATDGVVLFTGTEIVVAANISIGETSRDGLWLQKSVINNIITGSDLDLSDTTIPTDIYEAMRIWMNEFHYAPIQYVSNFKDGDTAVTSVELASNVENVAIVDNEMIDRLHESALLGLFYVPGVAKMVGSLSPNKA